MIVLRESGYVAVPWKNGGGITREICRVPVEGPDFDWRLSLATIDRDGPFSAFEGYERTLVLVRGAGVELDFGPHGNRSLCSPGQMVSFDGAWQTTGTLLDGPSTDLNLIVSRQRAYSRSVSRSIEIEERIQTAEWLETLVCCLSGSLQIESAGGVTDVLSPVDIARCSPADGVLTCQPRGAAARVFIASVGRRAPGV